MKKHLLVLVIALVALNAQAHIKMNNPLGGEFYQVGDTVIVEWEITIAHTLLNWDILFSDNGGFNYDSIQINMPPTFDTVGTITTYTWIVPNTTTTQARIKVVMDNAAMDYYAETTDFMIAQKNVNIPDLIFKTQLVGNSSINLNGDSEIQFTEAGVYVGAINVPGLGIADLTGIEAFFGITDLDCSANSLTALDVTQNLALVALDCGNNLINLLDVGFNTALTKLTCDSNNISILDISSNLMLDELACENNLLTALDVSFNTALTRLFCNDNQIDSIGLSNNIALTMLTCYNNRIATLDISVNTAVVHLECDGNKLSSLNVKNGNNLNFIVFSALNNPDLSCIQVDDAVWSTANWTQIDPAAKFKTDCTVGIRAIERHFLRIYPNPAYEAVTFEFEQYPIELKLFDPLGKLVFSKIINEQTFKLNVDEFDRGIYFYTTSIEDAISSGKLILW